MMKACWEMPRRVSAPRKSLNAAIVNCSCKTFSLLTAHVQWAVAGILRLSRQLAAPSIWRGVDMSPTWIATLGWAFAEFAQSRRHKTVYCGDAGSYAQPSHFAARRLGGIEERVEIANNVAPRRRALPLP